jgi:hypothetical protein
VALFDWHRAPANLQRYFTWLVELHTVGILLALAAPMAGRVKAALWMLAFSAALLLCYLSYYVFDTWPFARFLLPALPLLFILSGSVSVRLIERLPLALRGAAVLVLCTLVPVWYLVKARDLNVFQIQRAEHRYVEVGEAIGQTLEPNALILTQIQSGSVRLYGNRLTMRWDLLEPRTFDATLDALQRDGYVPYILLEGWEEAQFRERFSQASKYGRMDWPPRLMYTGTDTVRVYATADRARHLADEPIATRRISAARGRGSRTSRPYASSRTRRP